MRDSSVPPFHLRLTFLQLLINTAEHFQGGLEVVGDFPGQDFRLREVLQVFQALVFEPENVKAGLVPLD